MESAFGVDHGEVSKAFGGGAKVARGLEQIGSYSGGVSRTASAGKESELGRRVFNAAPKHKSGARIAPTGTTNDAVTRRMKSTFGNAKAQGPYDSTWAANKRTSNAINGPGRY